jgi:glycosyltransferase involved in cell wall biosynthesis
MNVPNLKQFQIESSKKKDFGFDGKYMVLFEGTIWKRRGIQTVIDAVELLKDKIPVYFLIVGDGPYKEDLQKIVVEKNLTDFVELTGWVDLTTLSRYLSISDICVIPFLKTKVNDRGVPNKLFEYTIHEKPVIASKLKGMSMTFSSEEILFCEAGDSKDFANKVLWSYENPENAKRMALSAKDRYLREYTWNAMEYELHRCYESLQKYKKENLGEKEPYSSPESV